MTYAHKFVSYLLYVVIIIPLYIIKCVVNLFLIIINSFRYTNFWEIVIPEDIYKTYGRSFKIEILGRISVIITYSIIDFWNALKEIKSLV